MEYLEPDEIDATLGRNALQPLVMTAYYDILTYLEMKTAIDVENLVSSLCEKPYADCDYFLKAEVIMLLKHYDEMRLAFVPNLRNWTFERLPRLTRAILLMTYAHYVYVEPDVEKGVVIDIAVKLSKKYQGEKDYRFINAILDHTLPHRE